MKIDRHVAVLGVMLSALPANSLFAQTTPAERPHPPLTVYARTVVEDVVVTDKSGRAVPGLSKGDFQVLENGKPQAITFFEPNSAATEAAAAQPAALPPDTFTNTSFAPPNNVSNVLLLDALNTGSTERMYAQVQMVKYLASLPPHVRIAVFTLGSEKLHMIWGFNQDSSELRVAIAGLTDKRSRAASPSPAAQQEAERQELLESVGAVEQEAGKAGDDRLDESANALRQFLQYHTANGNIFTTWNALEALAHYLAGIPGRKNLFWVSGNFPHQFKSDLYFNDWYRRTRDKLGEAEVSVYPIDANGVDVDTGGVQSGGSISASSARFEATEAWAEETGGKAYHENDIHQEIADAADHSSRYYTLAYVPSDDKEEGRERKVEIKVPSGDYKLFYRQRYFEQTPREILKSETAPPKNPLLTLMEHGMPNIGEIPYRLRIVPSAKQPSEGTTRAGANVQLNGKLVRYSASFHLLPNSLSSLVPEAGGTRRESLEVMVLVYSHDAKPLNWERQTVNLTITPAQWDRARTEGISFRFEIDAPVGDVYLRTGVYDSSANTIGTLEVPLHSVVQIRQPLSHAAPAAEEDPH